MPVTLTVKQARAMLFIQSTIDRTGTAPSFNDMRKHFGMASKSGVHRLVTALEERGYIRRSYHRARAIEVLHRITEPMAETGAPVCPHCHRPMTAH
jgi:repressor LexA